MSKGFILYHVTSPSAAAAILRGGFVDGEGSYGTDTILSGVFLSNRPLDLNEGVRARAKPLTLAVTFAAISSHDLNRYEHSDEENTYREWRIPAGTVRQLATVRRAEIDDGFVKEPTSQEAEIDKLREIQFLD